MTARPSTTLHDRPLPVRAKLAVAWTSFTFLYAYVDILGFYTPGVVEDILAGRVHTFELSQTFSTTALALVSVPIAMIGLSATLPATASRVTNLVVATLQVPFSAYNLSGGEYPWFHGLGVVLELVLLALVIRCAWTWPPTAPATTTTGPDAW